MIKKELLIFPISLLLIASCSGEIETESNSQLYLKCDTRNQYGVGYVNILFNNNEKIGLSRRLSVEHSYLWSVFGEIKKNEGTSSHSFDESVDLYYWNPEKGMFAQVNRKTLEFRWSSKYSDGELDTEFPITGQCRIESTDNVI